MLGRVVGRGLPRRRHGTEELAGRAPPYGFEYAPFAQEGGLGKVYPLFGGDLHLVLDDLARSLVA